MTLKYYQIRENSDNYQSVGVILNDGSFNNDKIKTAIQSHLDEEIEILSIEEIHGTNDYQIVILRVDGEKDSFNAEQTWLYI